MNRLDLASDRFDAALDSLLRTAEPLSKAQKSANDASGRLVSLNEERERLLLRIAELEEETRNLSGVTEEVENRLDSAIAEIRTALGR
jgi:predicted  nucleic acid-binding Zn-ribbon protein